MVQSCSQLGAVTAQGMARLHYASFNNRHTISSTFTVDVPTGWRTKCHTSDCARNTFLLLQKHLTSGTELILIDWKIVPNEEHVQCDHRFASQPVANEPLHLSQLFDTSLQKARTSKGGQKM